MDGEHGIPTSGALEGEGGPTRLAAFSAALADAGDAILSATTDDEVYAALCEAIVRHLGLPLVWVGLLEPGSRSLHIQVASGVEVGYLSEAGFGEGGVVPGGGIVSKVLRSGRPHAIADLAAESTNSPAWTLALPRFRSAAAFPIRTGHTVVGALQCTAREPKYFGADEMGLLGQLTASASSRLVALEQEHRRRTAEQRLTESEQRYRSFFEQAPVAIMLIQKGHLEVNPALLEMFEYEDQASLEAAGAMSIIDPDRAGELRQMLDSLEPGNAAPHIMKSMGRRADGSSFPLLVEGVQLELEGANSGLVFMTDLTTLEAAETASETSRAQMRSLIDSAPMAIVTVDLDGVIRSWNPAAERILGWAAAESIGHARPAIPALKERLHTIGSGHSPHLRGYETSQHRREGSRVDLRISSAPITDRSGTQSGILLMMEDVTDLNRMAAQQARLAIAIDQASESIVITGADSSIVYVNPAFERQTGYSRADVYGKNSLMLQGGEQGAEFDSGVWPTLKRSETWRGALVSRRKDGALFEEEASISPVFDPERKLINYIAVKRDVTRERELERERERSDARYRQMFTEMIGGMAVHEIICDGEGRPTDYRFLDVNPAFEAQTGLRAADIVGKTAHEVLPGLESEWVERYGRVALTGVPDEFESYNADLDRFYQVRAYCPAPGQFAVLFHDVTEIRERNAFSESVIASSGDGLIVFDRDLRCLVWNPAMEELTGLAADAVRGMRAPDILPETQTVRIDVGLQEVLETGETRWIQGEYEVPGTGQRLVLRARCRPHRDASGRIVGVIASVRDITEPVRAEAAVRQSEQELHAIFDGVGDGVAIHEPGGTFLEVNSVVCSRLGYSREELLTMSVSAINSPESAASVPERAATIMAGGTHVFELTHVARDGTEIPVEVVSRRIEFRGKPAVLSVHRDLTERRKAEAAMREQARYLQELIDALPMPIIAEDVDGRVRLLNSAFAKARGKSPEEVIGKTAAELGMPDQEIHVAYDKAVLAGGTPRSYEALLPVDGRGMRHHLLSKAAIRDEDGRATGIVTASLDISDRYEAEQAIRRSEERFRTLFDFANDAIYIRDIAGRFLEVNRTACEHLGYSREELLTMSVADIGTPEFAALLPARTEDIVSHGSGFFETAHLRRDGTVIPVEISTTVIDLHGHKAILSIARDITERKSAEAALRLSEARYRAIIEQLPGAIGVHRDGVTLEVNGPYRRMFLIPPHESMVGQPLLDRVAPESRTQVASMVQGSPRNASAPVEYETVGLRTDGTQFPMRVAAVPLELSDGPATVVMLTDLTDQRRAEREREETQEHLRAVVDSTADMIWSVDPVGFGLLDFNREFADYFLRDRGMRIKVGHRLEDIFPNDEHVRVWRGLYQRALREGSFTTDYTVFAGTRTLQVSLNALRRDGSAFGISVFGRDVTEQRLAETRRRESEERFRALFEDAGDAIFISTLDDGKFLEVNRAACQRLGYSREELLAMSATDIDGSDLAAQLPDQIETLTRQGTAILRTTHLRRDGTAFPVEINATVMEMDGRKVVMSVVRDVSGRGGAQPTPAAKTRPPVSRP